MTQLASRYAEFQSLNTEVVAISFGAEQWARAWIDEEKLAFVMITQECLARSHPGIR
ncbi:MAG: hypothetical protein DCC55_21985 [Chloroflexi bacterium]|nr:MAG: hypothetical protein DCC55_21985 [Chloroflexota bacterium]